MVIVVVAALNLILDFDFIETGVSAHAPKYMEWYGAFGLIVTLVWLYLEILRLLSKPQPPAWQQLRLDSEEATSATGCALTFHRMMVVIAAGGLNCALQDGHVSGRRALLLGWVRLWGRRLRNHYL